MYSINDRKKLQKGRNLLATEGSNKTRKTKRDRERGEKEEFITRKKNKHKKHLSYPKEREKRK